MTISTNANPYLAEKVRAYWTANGIALREFNTFCKTDPRIDTVLLPVYDGVTLIKWKPSIAKTFSNGVSKGVSNGASNGTNGFH
jgi:hypothetical protein